MAHCTLRCQPQMVTVGTQGSCWHRHPAGCLSGYSSGARGWDGADQAGPFLLGCPDAGLSSYPRSMPVLLLGCGHCHLAEPGKGRVSASFLLLKVGSPAPELGRDPSLSVSSSAHGDPCFGGEETSEPSGAEHPISLGMAAGQSSAQPHWRCPANRGAQPWGSRGWKDH